LILAIEPPDKIRTVFTSFRADLSKAAERDEGAKTTLEECEKMMGELPPDTSELDKESAVVVETT